MAALAGAPAQAQRMSEPPRPLRYVTLNLLHGGVFSGLTGEDEDLEHRFALLVAGLRALDPDIVGVQEASVSRRRGNVAARLAGELGLHYVWAPALFQLTPSQRMNRLIAFAMNFTEGPAILSRFPIVHWERHSLPRCRGILDPRALLHATLQTPWGPLQAASTHTASGACEAERVGAVMQARRGALPAVLMGDFNATETSSGIASLTNGGAFVDAFRAANPNEAGATVWQRVYAAAPTVTRRVDYVFLLPGTEVPGRVLASRIVLNTPGRLPDGRVLWPSDHYGVLAEVDVLGGPAQAGARP